MFKIRIAQHVYIYIFRGKIQNSHSKEQKTRKVSAVWENHLKPGNQPNVHRRFRVVGLYLNGGFAWYAHLKKICTLLLIDLCKNGMS